MATRELKVSRIGNSRGVRLPAATLAKYRIGDSVVMEERSDGILLRPKGAAQARLSWEETARAMALAREDWTEWDAVLGDGLESIPWEPIRRVAEQGPEHRAARPRRRRR